MSSGDNLQLVFPTAIPITRVHNQCHLKEVNHQMVKAIPLNSSVVVDNMKEATGTNKAPVLLLVTVLFSNEPKDLTR